MNDLTIRLFRQDIVNYINSVDLPIEIKRLVLAEIYNDVSNQAEIIIKNQLEEKKKGEIQSESCEKLQQDKLGELSK